MSISVIVAICIIVIVFIVFVVKFVKSNRCKQDVPDRKDGIVSVHRDDQVTFYGIDGPSVYNVLLDIPSRKETLFVSRLPKLLEILLEKGEVSFGEHCLKKKRKGSVVFGDGQGNFWAIRKSASSNLWRVYRIDRNKLE